MSDMKKIKINKKIYDVVELKEYIDNKDLYSPNYTAIHDPQTNMIYPVINRYEDGPGVHVTNISGYFYAPDDDEKDKYSDKNIIDFSDIDNIKQYIEKAEAVRDLEKEILTSPDNIFKPAIDDNDLPEMKALKEAIIDKNIDLDKYQQRFGPNGSNYNNDKRLLNKSNISLPMMKRLCNALDIKASLTLENKSDDTPNPMHKKITVELTESEE